MDGQLVEDFSKKAGTAIKRTVGIVAAGVFMIAAGAYWLDVDGETQGCTPAAITEEETVKLRAALEQGQRIETRRGANGFCELVVK